MRVISIYRPTGGHQHPPSPELIQKMGAFIVECIDKGILLATEGFGPSSKSDLKVRRTNGDYSVTDGPFTEAKEVIGGFAIMKFDTREDLLHYTRRFMDIAGDGECEIHQLSDESPMDSFRR